VLEQESFGLFCRNVAGVAAIETYQSHPVGSSVWQSGGSKSNYRRLQRFFAEVVFDYDAIAHLMMGLFDFQERPYYLTLDRTNWQWGKIDINILTLAVVYRGAAIPVYWLILNKRGNSNQRERIALLSRFLRQFGRQQLLGVLADREFIGGDWWQWLSDQQIPFVIRVKENQCLLTVRGQKMALSARFQDLRPRESRCLRKACQVSQHKVWLSGMRLSSGELLILAANQYVKDPFAVYALRWEIENLFQNLKGRGFHLEETRLTHYFRIKKVMALLAIAFAWAHKVGEWKDKVIKPLTVKSTVVWRKAYSVMGWIISPIACFSGHSTRLKP
jgi:hypothetical protein